jgi:hypothetical protein
MFENISANHSDALDAVCQGVCLCDSHSRRVNIEGENFGGSEFARGDRKNTRQL